MSSILLATTNSFSSIGYIAAVLLVGGGGAGGRSDDDRGAGGGGGAGQMLFKNDLFISPGIFTITIGEGGTGSVNSTLVTNGNNTSITIDGTTYTAVGGGAGAQSSGHTFFGQNGGSGGGAFRDRTGGTSNKTSYSGWASYGNSGGSNADANGTGGGGGGSGQAGGSGGMLSSTDGYGGLARKWPVDQAFYAGGGGGGTDGASGNQSYSPFSARLGGGTSTTSQKGGGGNGGTPGNNNAQDGVANTGGGGGGAGTDTEPPSSGFAGGSGGSGVVKIWIPKANYSNYTLGSGLTQAATQQVTYGGIAGTIITVTSSSGNTANDKITIN